MGKYFYKFNFNYINLLLLFNIKKNNNFIYKLTCCTTFKNLFPKIAYYNDCNFTSNFFFDIKKKNIWYLWL